MVQICPSSGSASVVTLAMLETREFKSMQATLGLLVTALAKLGWCWEVGLAMRRYRCLRIHSRYPRAYPKLWLSLAVCVWVVVGVGLTASCIVIKIHASWFHGVGLV